MYDDDCLKYCKRESVFEFSKADYSSLPVACSLVPAFFPLPKSHFSALDVLKYFSSNSSTLHFSWPCIFTCIPAPLALTSEMPPSAIKFFYIQPSSCVCM